MSSSRAQTPPFNLKERIAALEQRTVSPTPQAPSPIPVTPGQQTGSTNLKLKEKIAKFDKKGGVPVPRGRFGLGAPPIESLQPRKQGELYGNRIPGIRAASGGILPVGSPLLQGSSQNAKRRSLSMTLASSSYDSSDDTPISSPALSSPPTSPDISKEFPNPPGKSTLARKRSFSQGQSFGVAIDAAKKTDGLVSLEITNTPSEHLPPDEVAIKDVGANDSSISTSPSGDEPASVIQNVEKSTDPIISTHTTGDKASQEEQQKAASASPDVQVPGTRTRRSYSTRSNKSSNIPQISRSTIQSNSDTKNALKITVNASDDTSTQGGEVSITKPVVNYFGAEPEVQKVSPKVPESPLAKLAYDVPETPSRDPVTSPPPSAYHSASTKSRSKTALLTPSAATTKSADVVPSTPAATQYGSAVVYKPGENVETGSKPAFTAVVHRKVKETPSSTSTPSLPSWSPETTQTRQQKPVVTVEPVNNTGGSDLSLLLQEASWLEDTLMKGNLFTEVPTVTVEKDTGLLGVTTHSKTKEESQTHSADSSANGSRSGSASSKFRHSFLNPLTKSRSSIKKEASYSASDLPSQKDSNRPKSAAPERSSFLPQLDFDFDMKRDPLGLTLDRAITADGTSTKKTSDPPKSPRSRFSGFRKLGNISKTQNGPPGAYSRYSYSTSSELSSEDSALAITPPENMLEFSASSSVSEFGQVHPWPSASSPKKSTSSIGRAASFAEKMWSRARTRSGASTASAAETTGSSSSINGLHLSALPTLPDIPDIVQPSPDKAGSNITVPRAQSMRAPVPSPLHQESLKHPLPPFGIAQQSNMLSPDESQPTSWSLSSSGSILPTPLFDTDVFAAIPSMSGVVYPQNANTTSAITPSFDTGLLSSAFHLHTSSPSRQPAVSTPLRTSTETERLSVRRGYRG